MMMMACGIIIIIIIIILQIDTGSYHHPHQRKNQKILSILSLIFVDSVIAFFVPFAKQSDLGNLFRNHYQMFFFLFLFLQKK